MTAPSSPVWEWSARFRETPLASRVVAGLQRRSGEIWRRTFELLRRESLEYRNSVDDEFTRESQSHCKELLDSIIAVATGRTGADAFDFVRTHAEWRTRHQVPLIASLHAYRLAHKTYSALTQEALLRHKQREEALLALTMLSSFWIEFFDYVGSVLAEAHAVEEQQTVARNSRAYAGLIRDLLRGVEPRGAEAQRLRTLCGIRPGAPMAVAVARPPDAENGKAADAEVRARTLGQLLERALPSAEFGKLIEARDGSVTVIACRAADAAGGLAKTLRRGFGRRGAAGPVVGVSRNAASVSELPQALEEARLALEFASAAQPLQAFSDIDLGELLIRRADRTALRLIPEWTQELNEGDLARTVRAFADASLNIKQAARRLGVHPNTVYFRLNRIRQRTGVDARTFTGASLLLTALRLVEAHGGKKAAAGLRPAGPVENESAG